MMSFGEAVKTCLHKYATFKGRARRSEYWFFYLFTVILGFIFGAISRNTGSGINSAFMLFILIPSISVCVRRLHDIGRSGWWWWLNFIPIIGAIVLLIFCAIDSDPNENRYGTSPKYSDNDF